MSKVTLYIAASVDGYIAGTDDNLDWLDRVAREGEDYGYETFYAGCDALIMGRRTFDWITAHGPWPYPDKTTYLLSNEAPAQAAEGVVHVGTDAATCVATAQADGHENLWLVGGGAVVRSFLDADLIDEFIISLVPVLLGRGVPLFPASAGTTSLRLLSSRAFDSGLVQNHYRRVRKA